MAGGCGKACLYHCRPGSRETGLGRGRTFTEDLLPPAGPYFLDAPHRPKRVAPAGEHVQNRSLWESVQMYILTRGFSSSPWDFPTGRGFLRAAVTTQKCYSSRVSEPREMREKLYCHLHASLRSHTSSFPQILLVTHVSANQCRRAL